MSAKGWYTANDVIKDLNKATGIKELDTQHVIVGEGPPNRYTYIKDEIPENPCLHERMLSSYNYGKPDLEGISDMLKMVKQFNDVQPKPSVSNYTPIPTDIITISKLDPQTPEFIPSKPCSRSITLDENNISAKKVEDSNTKCVTARDIRKPKHESECFNEDGQMKDNNSAVNSDQCNIKEAQLQLTQLREKLKTKISSTSNTNCNKIKRERNLAIATLVKLHSKPTLASSTCNETIKLLTPHYFENFPPSHTKEKEEERCSKFPTPTPTEINEEHLYNDVNVRKSVDKVSQWLESSSNLKTLSENECAKTKNITKSFKDSNETQSNLSNTTDKSPFLYLGPVTYKKKVTSKPTSSDLSPNIKITNSSPNIYRPSEYASELSKAYMDNVNKVREASNIWSNLHKELSRRDEAIKQSLMIDQSASSSSEIPSEFTNLSR